MEELQYELWLTEAVDYDRRKTALLLRTLQTARQVYEARYQDYQRAGITDAETLTRLSCKNLSRAKEELKRYEEQGITVLAVTDPAYPERLFNIYDPPRLLFIRGNWRGLFERPCIAVVGTRTPGGEYGLRVARQIAKGLSQADAVVVTGLARGIDSCAAEGALAANGPVIGVLGCGLDVVYPPENGPLFDRVLQNGGILVSEFSWGERPHGWHFPQRNRVISGLSLGVVIVEADQNSGALITADHALEQGRDVFAVPGAITNRNFEGANRLLKEGAKMVTDLSDILSEYEGVYPIQSRSAPIEAPAKKDQRQERASRDTAYFDALPESLRPIARLLEKGKTSMEQIAQETGIPLAELQATLSEMELCGIITRLPGQQFALL